MMALIYKQQCYTCVAAVSAQANLRQQVKRSGRSQNLSHKEAYGANSFVKVGFNLHQQIKRSQNRRLQKGLPA